MDAFTVSQFRRALAEMASSPRLDLDLCRVTFVDSARLGALIGGIRHTPELGGEVTDVRSRPALVQLLRSTGFDRIVTGAATTGEAIGSSRASQPYLRLYDRRK